MHSHNYTKQSLEKAKNLRNKMTVFEEKLWFYLRAKRFCGLKFRRQVPIGNYIVDFLCNEKRLIVELDGSGHLNEKQIIHDNVRNEYLEKLGYKIIRIFNNEIEDNIDLVLEQLQREVFG